MFVQLTTVANEPLLIAIDSIVSVWEQATHTQVRVSDDTYYNVKETALQIFNQVG